MNSLTLRISEWSLLSFLLLFGFSSYSQQYRVASNKAIQAFYQYEHWDRDVSDFLQHYESKLTPTQKEIAGYIGYGIKVFMNKKLEITYHF
jgi:hypothetical protein